MPFGTGRAAGQRSTPMPRRPIVKREPLLSTDAYAKLVERGWRDEGGGMTHPRLAHPWPPLDALRLESERDAGNRAAVRLLGRAPVG